MLRHQSIPLWREAQRVIPVVQTQQHGGVVMTLLAIEMYPDGSVLTALLRVVSGTPEIPVRFPGLAFEFTMTDDRGGSYEGRLDQIRTHSGPDFWHGRAKCESIPAIDPLAQELRIEIPELRWMRQELPYQERSRIVPGEITHGPWSFTVRFPPAQLKRNQP